MGAYTIRMPKVAKRLGLGLGMDLPWGGEIGFVKDGVEGDTITPKMKAFFDKHRGQFSYLFFAFQPKHRNRLRAEDYYAAYDRLFAEVPEIGHRAFHHTMLNMGSLEPYAKEEIIEFTNAMIERYDLAWIVEDLGLWSLHGKVLPFPLPPYLTQEGLRACIRNIAEYQEKLKAPLCVEFAGFTEGSNFYIGDLDAFDYFREIAVETGSPVTIDIGHVLSYQWLKGNTGERMFEGLERLPLGHCFEFHLSGCQIIKGKFRDLHHGVLLDEQLDLLEHLLPLCPEVKAVTYEDPQYTEDGTLIAKAEPNFLRLQKIVERWVQG